MNKVTPELLREYKIFSDSETYNLLDRAADTIEELERYEHLEKQGRLLVLPCKEGTTIYQTCYKCICTLGHTYLHNTCHSPIECRKCSAVKIERWIRETTFSLSMLDRIGVDFFITREEAEEALKDI